MIIKRYLSRFIASGMRILDMGTGPYGVISLCINHQCPGCLITGADQCPELVNNALLQNHANNINFIVSDLFGSIDGKFDLIIFNAPYIGQRKGKGFGITESPLAEKRWQGGENGFETIERFLAASPEYLKANGIILLGVNHFYLSSASMFRIIEASRLQMVTSYKNNITQSALYVLREKQNE